MKTSIKEILADSNIEILVDHPLKFKAALGIGQLAYQSLRLRENLTTILESVGAGVTGGSLAATSTFAGIFFPAKASFLVSFFGMGAAAITPLGWVIGIGLATGGAYYGCARYFEKGKDDKLVVIPKFINTPLDLMALSLIELMLPLAIKISNSDGEETEKEIKLIKNYFVDHWGFNKDFVNILYSEVSLNLDDVSYKKLSQSLGKFLSANKDCNRAIIAKEFIKFLTSVIESDGFIAESEEAELKILQSYLS